MDRRQLLARLPLLGAAAALPVTGAIASENAAPDLQAWLDAACRKDVALYHLTQLTLALEAINGGRWKGVLSIEKNFALAVQWDKSKSGVFIDPNGDTH